jgi:hypothetical protein
MKKKKRNKQSRGSSLICTNIWLILCGYVDKGEETHITFEYVEKQREEIKTVTTTTISSVLG